MPMHAIKFHPAQDDIHQLEQTPKLNDPNFVRKAILFALALAIALGLICKMMLAYGRFFQGATSIEIKNVSEKDSKYSITRHLANLQLFDKNFVLPGNKNAIKVAELIKTGDIRIVPTDNHTISIFATGEDKIFVRNILKFITESYISDVKEKQQKQLENISRQQKHKIEQFQKLNQQYKAIQEKLANLSRLIDNEHFDKAISKYIAIMQKDIKLSEQYVNKLSELNQKISQVRAELRNPTIQIAPDKLEKARKENRMYMGDYNMLKLKHQAYIYYFKKEANQLSQSISSLRKALQKLSENVSKRLDMDLPAELTDDLLELNLAAELYEGKLTRFQERWTRYFNKLTEIIADPRQADFSSLITVLSQLRQDLRKGLGQLPTKLYNLSQKLQRGGNIRKKSGLSKILIRNIARSNLTPQLDRCIELWNKTLFHLNRLFPDENIRLKTLARICSRLQSRLKITDKNIKYKLEQKQLIRKKRLLQRQLVQLQLEFEQTSRALIGTYEKLSTSQTKLAKLGKAWPKWEKLKLASINIESQLKLASKQIKNENISNLSSEHLKAGPILITARNRFGLKPENELMISIISGLITFILIASIQLAIVPKFLRHANN